MTTAAGPDAVEDSLVLNLDAGNYRSYPGSGNTWYDLSGSKTNCTLVNNPSFSISNGGFLIFTGTQFGIVPLPSVLTVSNFSYNIWVYPTALGGWQTMIDQDNDDFLFATLGSTVQLYDQSINTGINLSVNTWYNLSVTYNSGSPVLFYKNGKLEYNGPNASTTHTTSNYGIGGGITGSLPSPTADELWLGRIAIVQIYNRALTSNEITQNFNANRGRFGI